MHALRPWSLPILALLAGCNAATGAPPAPSAPNPPAAADAGVDALAHGEYLVRVSGCNDCHTPGYAESAGQVPKEQWLVGSPLGWSGPWGTTYAANLRQRIGGMDEATWMAYSAQLHTRPPMPDMNVRAMTADDRRAIYRFVRALGVAGQPAPAYLPPGQKPKPPYVEWVLPAPAPDQAPKAAPATP
jgi:mono/diheme cytochrome c family protein